MRKVNAVCAIDLNVNEAWSDDGSLKINYASRRLSSGKEEILTRYNLAS